jgi:hypothetical protein
MTSPLYADRPRRPLVQKAWDVAGIPKAFRPEPLIAEEMAEFYSDSLNRRRGNHLFRRIKDDLLESAGQGFFFKGILYGKRGVGKSKEINRLLADGEIKSRFLIIRLDATDDLNPRTFSVVDVLLLMVTNLILQCMETCKAEGKAFHEAGTMLQDLQKQLAPFFPELQDPETLTRITGGSGELNFLSAIKVGIRVEGQRKSEPAASRERLSELKAVLDGQITIARGQLPQYELLVIGENFDKEQIALPLLQETFVQYAGVLQDLRLHMLFMLPVPFVYAFGPQIGFRMENRCPVYDVPVFTEQHQRDNDGCAALTELLEKRADVKAVFADDALELLLRASG